MWGGLEATGIAGPDFASLAAGPRLAFIVADLSLKRRRTWAHEHRFLTRQESYDADDLDSGDGAPSKYGAWDLSLSGLIPTPIGFGVYELAGTFVDGVPSGYDLFEEYQTVVVRGDSIFVVRAGFAFWLIRDKLVAGALGEWLSPEGREQTWRAGPLVNWTLTDHLSADLVYSLPVSSPDDLGLWSGAWGTARLRYTWASGEEKPAFP